MRQLSAAESLFAAPGEMAERCRTFDWSRTPLGPVETWSQSLRTMASAVLASRNPMLLFWGPHLIQFYNDAFRPSLGPSDGPAPRHPRALGMSATEFWTDVWSVVGPQIEGVMTRGEAVWFEDLHLPIERGAGVLEDAWWTYSYSPVRDDDGRINGTLVVCLETTSSVKARAAVEFERKRLTDLFENAPAFMCVLRGPDMIFERTNENYQQLIGYRDVIGLPLREALPEIEPSYLDLLAQVFTTGETYVGRDAAVTLRTHGGNTELRYVNFVFQAIVEADGTRSGIFVHGVDMTESVNMRKELESARVAAESANRAKSEFLAVMSHELRTPLNAIDGYAELLELGVHGPLTEAQRDDIDRIRRSERHLLSLINEVLNFTRIEAGAVTYAYEDVDLVDAIAMCDALTVPQRRAKSLSFAVVDCPVSVKVHVDPEKLQQILINLLSNAIKFTEPHGAITLSCEVKGSMVDVSVTDTGLGIPPEQFKRIFDPFVQVSTGPTRAQEGVGLGLAISRDLARAMGGDLTVTSKLGKGSTFTLTLRRSDA